MARLLIKAFAAAAVAGLVACAQPAVAPAAGGGDDPKGATVTVTFDAKGGTPEPAPQTFSKGGFAKDPGDLTRGNDVLKGWYTEEDCNPKAEFHFKTDPVGADTTLYAKWQEMDAAWDISTLNQWNAALAEIKTGGAGGADKPKRYALNILAGIQVPGKTDTPTFEADYITVIIQGKNGAKVSLSTTSKGSLLNIAATQTVEAHNVTLEGHAKNSAALVYIGSQGTFKMDGEAKVSGNTNGNANGGNGLGGGVYILGGALDMASQAEISNNSADSGNGGGGGGVYATEGGVVTMGGEAAVRGNASSQNGGGLTIAGGTMTMKDKSTVAGNTGNYGAGILVSGGTLTMSDDATVTGPGTKAAAAGGGVMVSLGAKFNMEGKAAVSGYQAGKGGGVFIQTGAAFTMAGNSKVYGNVATSGLGGGILVSGKAADSTPSSFTLSENAVVGDGTVEDGVVTPGELGNAAKAAGGGVYVGADAVFTMTGGLVIGNTSNSTADTGAGGGVSVEGGTFDMQAGEVSGNKLAETGLVYGGGVSLNGGKFVMGNKAKVRANVLYKGTQPSGSHGAGVFVTTSGAFTMEDGAEISGNKANNGGGVFIFSGSYVTMNGGLIVGNTAYANGGGVFAHGGTTFYMAGGTLAQNTAGLGGGVFIHNSGGNFLINAGTVYGADDADNANVATAGDGGSSALYGPGQYGAYEQQEDPPAPPVWVKNGDLSTSQNTITIVNGQIPGNEEP